MPSLETCSADIHLSQATPICTLTVSVVCRKPQKTLGRHYRSVARGGIPTELTGETVNPILVTRESTPSSLTTVLASTSSPWYGQALRAEGVRDSVELLTSVAVRGGLCVKGVDTSP